VSCKDTPNYKHGKELIPGVAGREYVEKIRKIHPVGSDGYKYRVLGEFPSFAEGTIYGPEYARAVANDQVGDFSWDPCVPVYGFWDFGDVYTAAVFAQFIQGRIRLIDDYYYDKGGGLPYHVPVIQAKPYPWGKPHYAGPDLTTSNARSIQTATTTVDMAASLGMSVQPVIAHPVEEGREAVRGIWPLLDINKSMCGTLLPAITDFKYKKNEILTIGSRVAYQKHPMDNYAVHIMAALRHLAICFRYMRIGGEYIGDVKAGVAFYEQQGGDYQSYDDEEWLET
jgi:hypothetical protein